MQAKIRHQGHMKVFDVILPRVYRFIKQNPRIGKGLKAIWLLLPKLRATMALFLHRKDTFTLPLKTFSESKQWYDDARHRLEPLDVQDIHPKQIVKRSQAKTLGNELYWKFRNSHKRPIRENIVMNIPQARIIEEGYVVSPDEHLLVDFSIVPDIPVDKHPLLVSQKTLLPPKILRGKTAVLTAHGGRGYYHWMFEVLPRLELIRKAGWELSQIDNFVVNSQVTRFQIESLKILGVPRQKVVESHWNPHIRPEFLIVPSIPEYVSPWVCDFLRKSFLPKETKDTPKRRLYISRAKAAHRRLINEQEVSDLLSKFDFEQVFMEEYSIPEQAAMMQEAAVIVAPHGAGLTNLVFCQPETTVIELIYPRSVKKLFWTISSIMQLNYYYLFAKGDPPPEGVHSWLNSNDMDIDLHQLETLLNDLI